jgi:hypothetical protein
MDPMEFGVIIFEVDVEERDFKILWLFLKFLYFGFLGGIISRTMSKKL